MQCDLDEITKEADLAEEKSKRTMVDAARLADELRNQQELAQCSEKECKLFECQLKDMQLRLDEAETNALKGGKKAMNKMDTRIRELESELEIENRRYADAQKNLCKSERRIKELTYASEEDHKNQEHMSVLVDQLQSKIKGYKKMIVKAEEIAALNLSKFRQAQNNLADAEEHADLNEKALTKSKAIAKCASFTDLVSITYLLNKVIPVYQQILN